LESAEEFADSYEITTKLGKAKAKTNLKSTMEKLDLIGKKYWDKAQDLGWKQLSPEEAVLTPKFRILQEYLDKSKARDRTPKRKKKVQNTDDESYDDPDNEARALCKSLKKSDLYALLSDDEP